MVYSSRSERCKTPFGAVTSGTVVRFTLRPPRLWAATRVILCARDDLRGKTVEVPLAWRGLELGCDVYAGELDTIGMLGPIWYHFRIERADGYSLYYGNNEARRGGVGKRYDSAPVPYQLTVTHPGMDVPVWYGRGVTYHIFPDRFRRKKLPKPEGLVGDRLVHRKWSDCPDFLPDENGEVRNRDFFGGDLAGVSEKLPYLHGLGVRTIYFSPIFEAASNHRYDTADYTKIDPMFGTEAEFSAFCAKARKWDIRVMLDGVFNHTGFDSVYFNGRGTYDSVGAAQSEASPYFPWYSFDSWPDSYSSWWGVYTLPQVNESEQSYVNFLIQNEDSVIKRWLRAGASGWRLDVADELPDETIALLRQSAREVCPDAVIVGEVWEDASNKVAYGVRRQYLLGRELDGVMNYPFRDGLIGYLLGGNAADFAESMMCLMENYPWPCFASLMNIVGTHDTPRILTVLGAQPTDWQRTKAERGRAALTPEQRELALLRLKLAAVVQFAFPGSPCVYYGDEAGLEGYEDPFNRRGYPWGKEEETLVEWYRQLGKARNASACLQDGLLRFERAEGAALAFSRTLGKTCAAVAVNCGRQIEHFDLPWTGGRRPVDALSDRVYPKKNGRVAFDLGPMEAVLFV